MNDEDKKFILRFARDVIEKHVAKKKITKPEKYPEVLDEKRGVFCTIKKNGKLRGCIGIPYPVMSLLDALIDAAQEVCHDPRFPLLQEKELKEIKIEISVLTEPKILEKLDYDTIVIGKDGLIIKYGPYSGLLLPQVAKEYNWTQEEFLDNLCIKAGLQPGMWKLPGAILYRFQAEVFSE